MKKPKKSVYSACAACLAGQRLCEGCIAALKERYKTAKPRARGSQGHRAARTDRNHQEIAEVFRKAGFSVADTSRLGGGFPDLVVGIAGRNYLIEVKDGTLVPSRRKLTDDEAAFVSAWRGGVDIIDTPARAEQLAWGWAK